MSAARPLRVFVLTSLPLAPPWNGADKNLARALVEAGAPGVEFRYLGGERPRPPGAAVPTPWYKLRLYARLLAERQDVDLVHVLATLLPGGAGQVALLALPLLRRRRLVVTCPSGERLPERVLRRADAVVAVSRQTAARACGLGLASVHRIPPGVDVARFRPGPAAGARAALGVGAGPAVLFAGHHDPGGGLEESLALLGRLRRRHPSARLLLAMRTRPGQGAAGPAASLRRLAAAHGVLEAVVELGPAADMRAALRASTAVVFQPARLGLKMDLPLSLLEALACGRGVVVSPLPTLAEIADGSPAVLVAGPGDERVLEHLCRLAADPGYERACARAARLLAERRYSAAGMAAAYARLYRQVLAGGAR